MKGQLLSISVLAVLGIYPLAGADPVKVPTVDEWIKRQAKEAPLALIFRGSAPDDLVRWQGEFSAKLRALLGPHSPPQKWRVDVERSADLDDHRLDELVLSADGFPPLPVCVLIPKGKSDRPRPGILALHGHGPNGHYAVAKGQAGRDLVRRGYVVVAPCLTPFGRRLGDPEAYGKQDACGVTFVRMQLLGKVLMAENLRDCLWAFEFLARRQDVDPKRLACAGLSYGGRMTMLTAALEPRIRVAVVSGALNVMQERVGVRYSCGAQVIPGLLQYGDVPEIAALIAPRHAVWTVGSKDTLIEPRWAEEALTRMRRAYKAAGASERLQVDRFEGGHTWNWDVARPLMEKVLKGSPR
jgi:dienelactone hydrolase